MREQISGTQYLLLVANFFSSSMLSYNIQPMMATGRSVIWLVPLLFWLIGGAMVTILLRKEWKGTTWALFSQERGSGVRGEKGLAFLLFLFFLVVMIKELRMFNFFITTVLLQKTPNTVILFVIVLAVIYVAHGGLEVVARFTDLFFPITFLVLIFSPLFTSDQLIVNHLYPLLAQEQLPNLLGATYLGLASFGEWIILLLLIPYVDPKVPLRRMTLFSLGVGIFLLVIVYLTDLLVLGVPLLVDMVYPTYIMVRQIHFTDFLDRLDLFLVAIWMPTIFAKLALNTWALSRLLSLMVKRSNQQTNTALVIFLAALLSLLLFPDMVHLSAFSAYTWGTLGLFLQVLIFILYLLLRRRHVDPTDPV